MKRKLTEDRYLHTAEKDAVEHDRLAIQASFLDPVTIRHLKTFGVVEGWTCLDVGAGAGSIAQWLATCVGSTGHVVATDIDMRFLQDLSVSNLEVRQHDILRDDLETDHYDVVHCRLVLMHLSKPKQALRQMAAAVRPGGWLLIEEQDYGSTLSLDMTDSSPLASRWVALMRTGLDCLHQRGFVDPYFGRRVRGLVEGLGFVDVDHEGWTRITRGGDPLARERAIASENNAKILVSTGEFTQEEIMPLLNLLSDPSFYYLEYTLFSAWGRKPSS